MNDYEFDGHAVALALKNPATAEATSHALVGCGFYLDDPEEMARIVSPRGVGGPFNLAQPARWMAVSLPLLARGYIVEDRELSRLEALIDTAKAPHLKAADEARLELAKRGISHPSFANDDAIRLANALLEAPREKLPSFDTRLFIAQLLKQYGLHRAYIQLAKPWLEDAQCKNEPAVDVLIQLTSSYRSILDFQSALACTDVAVSSASRAFSERQKAILFCQRAAIFLDLYGRRRDKSLLTQSRLCAKRAYAIECSFGQPSAELRAVFNRLEEAEAN